MRLHVIHMKLEVVGTLLWMLTSPTDAMAATSEIALAFMSAWVMNKGQSVKIFHVVENGHNFASKHLDREQRRSCCFFSA